jgi:hypothetical protein
MRRHGPLRNVTAGRIHHMTALPIAGRERDWSLKYRHCDRCEVILQRRLHAGEPPWMRYACLPTGASRGVAFHKL